MSEFVGPFGESDAASLEQQTNEVLEERFEGWTPAEGDLLTWLNKAKSRLEAQLYDQASVLFGAAFQSFGEKVASVPPILAAPASVSSVWTMIDNAGYTIPVGTEVSIAASGDSAIGFRTVADVTVAPGSTTAAILLAAIEPGEAGNDLSADPELVTALSFVASITLEGVTAGGVEEEEEDVYLNRLVEELQLRSTSLIVGRDFAIDARSVPGIARAQAVEAYNTETDEEEALAVSVVVVDESGNALSSGVKDALKERQEAKLLSGINLYIADPDYTKIKVKVGFATKAGFDPAAVEAAVEARLAEYLDPANWGLPEEGDSSRTGGWVNRPTVYRFELVSEVDRVPGVDRVKSVELAKQTNSFGTADVTMTGKVPLTEAGTIEASAE